MTAGAAAVQFPLSEKVYPFDFRWGQRARVDGCAAGATQRERNSIVSQDWRPRLDQPAAPVKRTFSFGRFRLVLHRRELFENGIPVAIGNRALDVLIALIEANGELVTKDELFNRVWPGTVVEENCLQFQISTIRKLLGDHRGFIRTIFGRGYRFIAEISTSVGQASAAPEIQSASIGRRCDASRTNLPARTLNLIARDASLADVANLVSVNRLVTLVGPGGVGKTHLGVELARTLLPDFADGVWIAELGTISDPALVLPAIGTALGLADGGAISPERLIGSIGSKQLLLVLDDCGHVIDAAARIVEMCLHAISMLKIIAISQEPLRSEGECVYRVPPLDVPADGIRDTAEIFRHGAVKLFVTRMQALEPRLPMDARVAFLAGKICRRLDGMPLAIELAASRAATLGLDGLIARLDDQFNLLIDGRRTAPARHQTLRATLDWSYGLLAEPERVVMRRLAFFADPFTMDQACAIASSDDLTELDVVHCVARLVAKSLVIAGVDGQPIHYSFLQTTRAYARERLAAAGEEEEIGRRLARLR
jgi:predicted ATPase/DNA-binding winged helix-turn-helix (wHTH) protein